jgi:hypothetical protein
VFIYIVEDKKVARLSANGLGDLVSIVAVGRLELLDELHVLGLSGLGGELVLLDHLLPGVVLGLALEVEHARLLGLSEVLTSTDLVERVKLEELGGTRLGGELLGVLDGLLERFALSRHGDGIGWLVGGE